MLPNGSVDQDNAALLFRFQSLHAPDDSQTRQKIFGKLLMPTPTSGREIGKPEDPGTIALCQGSRENSR
jgi:hypothetical protein